MSWLDVGSAALYYGGVVTTSPLLLTLGYGKRSIDETPALLAHHFPDLPADEAARARGRYRTGSD